jgi:hypothetical protein
VHQYFPVLYRFEKTVRGPFTPEPAKLLALIFAKKGETLTMPGPGSGPR